MQTNISELIGLLPQKAPFLFVSEVIELVIREHCIAKRYVDESEYYFRGHFPGKPIMPGCLIIESIAQTAGLMFLLEREGEQPQEVYLAQIKKATFYYPVMPGDTLIVETKLIRILGNMMEIKGEVKVGGRRIATAGMYLATGPQF